MSHKEHDSTAPDADEKEEKKTKKKASPLERIRDTIRNRKATQQANAQRFVPIAEIRNDTVILKNGGLRAVLLVEPINFNLKSETEQQGIIAGYESFVNTLTFPLQIAVRSTRVNIDPYIKQIHEQAEMHDNELLKNQTLAYADFVEKIVEVADIMQKRFYVVIPLSNAPRKRSTWSQFLSWVKIDDTLAKALQRGKYFESQSARLRERIDLVDTGLRNIGLIPRRLTTLELIQLYYQVYNKNLSKTQKLPEKGELNTEENVL